MKKFRVRIEQDQDASNPRKEWDHVGTMVCWHRRYNLGDDQPSEDAGEYLLGLASDKVSGKYPEALLIKNREKILHKHYVILPLYLYDHSGITMSCSSFSCPWDSGQVGFIYCDLKKALEELVPKGCKSWDDVCSATEHRPSMTVREITEKYLRGEVEEYDQYLTGDVHGYIVESFDPEDYDDEEDDDHWQHEDSCWGFFGEEYCRKEGESIKESYEKKEAEAEVDRITEEERYHREVEPFLPAMSI